MAGGLRRRGAAFVLGAAVALMPAGARYAVAGVTGVATDDSYEVDEDTELVVNAADGVLANDGPAGPPTLCVVTTDVTGLNGRLPLDSLSSDGSFRFTPTADFRGSTSFTYTMGTAYGSSCPEGGPSNTATVTITVRSVNDPPIVVLDATCVLGVTVAEDSDAFVDPARCVEMQAFGPPDENNQSFVEWLVATNSPELFSSGPTVTPVFGQLGALSFKPARNANGTATVRVRGRDSGGTENGGDDTSEPARFEITITPVNDRPTAEADEYDAVQDQSLEVEEPGVLDNDGDVDGDDLTAEIVDEPANGTVELDADGGFTYAPAAGFSGTDSFTYRASDGKQSTSASEVTITVEAVAAPTASPGAPSTAPSGLEPSASPAGTASSTPVVSPASSPSPAPAAGEGGVPLPLLLAGLLVLLVLAFGAAVLVPRWQAARRAGPPSGP